MVGRLRFSVVCALALLMPVACLTGCQKPVSGRPTTTTTAAPGAPPLKVAWLNQGTTDAEGDFWTAAHDRAHQDVQAALGSRIQTRFVQLVRPGENEMQTIDQLVADGYKLIFATSFPLSADILAASKRYPQVHFEQARGVEVRANVGTYGGADEEPIYLAGMAAGATSTTGRIGFVGTVREPETVRHVNAFALGVRRTAPTARVTVEWSGSWWDPDQEMAAARRLLAEGNDVLATGSTSIATGIVANEAGVGWVGHDADHSKRFPDVWLTGAVPDWARFYEAQVRDQLAGRWKATPYYGSLADGYTSLAPIGSRVPPATQASIRAAEADIKAGRLDVFAGPLIDAQGNVRVTAGRTLSLPKRLTIDWLLAGIVEEPAVAATSASDSARTWQGGQKRGA